MSRGRRESLTLTGLPVAALLVAGLWTAVTAGETTAAAGQPAGAATGQSTTGQSTTGQSTTGQSTTGQSATGQSTTGQADHTASGQPTLGKPASSPSASSQSASKPASGQSTTGQSTAGHPSTAQPPTDQASPGQPASGKPASKQAGQAAPEGAMAAAPGGSKEKTASAADAAGAKPEVYPVRTVKPVKRPFKQVVRGYGVMQADPRSARSLSLATAGVVRSVEVAAGEHVQQGQLLLTVEPDPLAYLAYRQAANAERLARAEVARLKALMADNLATATQVQTAEKALADAEAALEAARRQGAAAGTQEVHSPVEGIVTAIAAGVGDRPAVGTALATVAPANGVSVMLGAEPGDARLLHTGDIVRIRAIEAGGSARTGRVRLVGAALDKTTRLIPVLVTLDHPRFEDYPAGSAVEGMIETSAIDAFSVPRAAIVQDEEGMAVFEVVDGKAHRVPVRIEVDEGNRVGVAGELDASRPVVTTGAYELEDGVAVAEQQP